MSEVEKAYKIVANFFFKKGDYKGAEEQLSKFADSYAKLSYEEAVFLRNKFKAKEKLGWLRISSTIFCKFFSEVDDFHKDRLCKMFFALYSFENLDFGFDGVNDLILVADKIKENIEMARKNWDVFSRLTSNEVAINNLENKIFN